MRRFYYLLVSLQVIFFTGFAQPAPGVGLSKPASFAHTNDANNPDLSGPAPWRIIISISPHVQEGSYNSLAINPLTGQPNISYYDHATGDLMFAFPGGGSPNCGINGNTWTCTTIDDGGTDNVGLYSSLDFHLDGPLAWSTGIAYQDATTHSIKFYQKKCVVIYCTTTIQTVLPGVGFDYNGQGISFKYQPSSGIPYIASYTQGTATSSGLTLMHLSPGAGNCGPSNDWVCDRIESGNMVGENPSLAFISDGSPLVAYFNHLADALRLAQYQGVGATGNNCGPFPFAYKCSTIDGGGMSASLFVSPNNLGWQVAYYEPVGGTLRFAETTHSGNCGAGKWNCSQIDSIGAALDNPGLALVQDAHGKPFIAYQRPGSGGYLELYQAQKAPGVGNCGPGLAWQCNLIYSRAIMWENVGDWLSIGLKPSGLIQIAFDTMTPTYFGDQFLDLAEQNALNYIPAIEK